MHRSSLARLAPFVILTACGNAQTSMDATVDASADVALDTRTTDTGSAADASDAGDAADAAPRNILETIPASETWTLPGLQAEAQVLRTAANVPHVYAANRADLALIQGFTVARDRFFVMDMARRLSLGSVSSLLGDAALATDMDNRVTGMAYVADQILANLTPDQAAFMDAFAQGINDYIDQVRGRHLPGPTEYDLAALAFGLPHGYDLMQRFDRRDMAAVFATFVYQLGFETDDISRGRADAALATAFEGAPLQDLRRAGARTDIFERIVPLRTTSSAAGWGTETATMGSRLRRTRTRGARRDLHVPDATLAQLAARLDAQRLRLGRVDGFGSNAWAVGRSGTPDGSGLLSSDGHLPLTSPALFFQVGLDTTVLGAGDMHVMGVTIPGMPMIAVGTNGEVAWGETQLGGDITDWYREELTLDAQSGAPVSALFQGQQHALTPTTETFTVADVPALNSVGRTETWTRYTTFDGRWIAQLEGRTVTRTEALNPGETRVWVMGGFVVPSDTDGDGKITALSFDYAGLDGGNLIGVYDAWNHAHGINDFRDASHGLLAASQNYVAADATGSVFYTSYQAVPCRNYLDRNADRTWAPGADPSRLLDGTRYGGFRIPITNGRIDEAPGATDAYACVVPFDRMPAALDPARGYVFTANNDIGNVTADNSLTNDPFYVGGPWNDGYRAYRINERLQALASTHTATEDAMASIQADHKSPLGGDFLAYLLDAVDQARADSQGSPVAGTPEARLAAMYQANGTDYEAVATRLRAWQAAGLDTPSGVQTFYNTPQPGDAANSVATTLFNAWFDRVLRGVFDDEGFPPGTFAFGGTRGSVRTLRLMLEGRGAGNPSNLASWNSATGESAFFDVLSTSTVETSREVILSALDGALTFLRSPPTSPGAGGYGSTDMNTYLWGLRHHVRFDSILADFLGNDPTFSFVIDRFTISPQQLPLMPNLPPDDPRATLPGFPRPGDEWNVDADDPGLDGSDFTIGSGPNFRLVVNLRPGHTSGRNILPGGQSGIPSSPHFSDQAALWLGNQTLPLLLAPTDVVAAATSREYFRPAP